MCAEHLRELLATRESRDWSNGRKKRRCGHGKGQAQTSPQQDLVVVAVGAVDVAVGQFFF